MALKPRGSGADALKQAMEARGENPHSLAAKTVGEKETVTDNAIRTWLAGGTPSPKKLYAVVRALTPPGPDVLAVLEDYKQPRLAVRLRVEWENANSHDRWAILVQHLHAAIEEAEVIRQEGRQQTTGVEEGL